MNRRELIALLGGSAAVLRPRVAGAQQADRVRRIAVLLNTSEGDPEGQARLGALRAGLADLDWVENQNVLIEVRWSAGDAARGAELAAALVAAKPDVIFAAPTSQLALVQRATSTIPTVFAQLANPVEAGFVTSLARPGGNKTGFTEFEYPIGAKWLELLKQIDPHIARIAVLYDPSNVTWNGFLDAIQRAAISLEVKVFPFAVSNPVQIEDAFVRFGAEAPQIPIPGPVPVVHRDLIISLARRYKFANVYGYRYYPVSGGLASYGIDNIDLYRRAASYVSRILKGEKASELPVQQPSKFELVINLKTA